MSKRAKLGTISAKVCRASLNWTVLALFVMNLGRSITHGWFSDDVDADPITLIIPVSIMSVLIDL